MKNTFTMANAGQSTESRIIYLNPRPQTTSKCKWAFLAGQRAYCHAFTMAEILLSLTIIGIVAAITLPSLTGSINERVWNAQRKTLYARFSQALNSMPSLSGYGIYQLADEDTGTNAEDTTTETFITDGLAKVMKINNICDHKHLEDCGIVTSYTNLAGSINLWPTTLSELNSMFTDSYSGFQNPQSSINTKTAAFETHNGESIAVYYNPQCVADMGETAWHYSQPKMCANFIYDLNGNKGPNTVGKDIGFITALYPSDPIVVAPMPIMRNIDGKEQSAAGKACTDMDAESRLPNREELSAMFYNRDLIGISSGYFWSSSVIAIENTNRAWFLFFSLGTRSVGNLTGATYQVRCVKR